MRAWQFIEPGKPLELRDVDEPSPGEGQVLISVRASGLCHTELGFIDGVIPAELLAHTPMTFGHEIAGVVTGLGPGVTEFSEGDAVGVMSGIVGPAFGYDGGFASKVVTPVEHVVRAPDGVPFDQLAVGADAGMVAHAGLRKAGVKAGMKVGIIGLGGVGLCGAQMANMMGAEVHAAEPREPLHEHATRWGLASCVKDTSEFAGLELDAIVDYAGFGTTTAAAVDTIKSGGTIVLIGAGANKATITTTTFAAKNVIMIGSQGAEREDLLAFWDYLSKGLDPMVTPLSFDDIGDGLDRLARGEAYGRMVALLDG